MCPELFDIGPIPIRSYGLTLAISFFLGVLYVKYVTKRDGKDFEPYLNLSYIIIFAGVIGARVSYVLFHLSEFQGRWLDTFNPFGGNEFGIAGLNLYGGVLLSIISTYLYCKFKKMNILEVFDYFSPTLALGLGITRIGCFLNGCCFGTPTDLPWGISFPEGSIPYYVFNSEHLHPSQIYSSLYGLGLFFLLHFLMTRKKFNGQLVALLFMVEALFRYLIEYVRYYEDAMYVSIFGMHPTYNHLISISLFLLGLTIYLVQNQKTTKKA
ncbi:MAG: prolipoprotein diacylglyceryl transferase [Calditrichaeota bacterium]|nr:MAG: prolipoprotein diacylglyceryl transferase [Calditrichota bacterium]